MERLSTADLPVSGRVAAWNELWSSRMSRVEFTPGDQQRFAAELRIGRLGPVKLARLTVGRCSIERSRRHLAQSPRLYSFLLQARGSSLFQHYGHEARLDEGDVVLCDTGRPHLFTTADESVTVMVRVTPEVLRQYLPTLEPYCGLRLPRSVGVTNTFSAMVQALAEQADFGACADYERRLGRQLLELVSIAYSIGFEDRSGTSEAIWRRRNEVLAYIEEHLGDPSLSVEAVAGAARLSPRHLRAIFCASGEKVSAYIRRRRLEECARRLRDPAWRRHTLIKIAFSCGFNSAAHFTRAFRDQYALSPREYRRRSLA